MVPPADRSYVFARSDDDGATWPAANQVTPSCLYDDGYTATCQVGLAVLGTTVYGVAMAGAYGPPNTYYMRFRRSDGDGTGSAVVGQGTAIAIDGTGDHVYIAYYDTTNKDLKFARSDDRGVNWITRTVDGKLDVGESPSIAVTGSWPTTTVSIVYYDATNKDLKFARSTSNGDTW
jgi:hypothetical protein